MKITRSFYDRPLNLHTWGWHYDYTGCLVHRIGIFFDVLHFNFFSFLRLKCLFIENDEPKNVTVIYIQNFYCFQIRTFLDSFILIGFVCFCFCGQLFFGLNSVVFTKFFALHIVLYFCKILVGFYCYYFWYADIERECSNETLLFFFTNRWLFSFIRVLNFCRTLFLFAICPWRESIVF